MLTNIIPDHERSPTEVIVVGAGAVGLVLGIALARAGRRVLVVEAGPSSPDADFTKDNAGPSTGRAHRGLTEGRMKALGGTTLLWGGQLVPFGAGDFSPSYAGKPAWPIDHADLAPYTERVLDNLGVPEEVRRPDEVWQRLGKRPVDLGPEFAPTMNIWLPVADFTRLFAAEIRALPGLTILTGCAVEALDFAADGRVAAVRARTADGTMARLTAPQVVLANGTMEVARTLLRAAALGEGCPFSANAHIGRGFIDHLHGIVGRVIPADLARLREGFENIHLGGRKYSIKIRASDAFLGASGIANCAATLNPVGSARQALTDLRDLSRRLFARGSATLDALALVREAIRTLRLLTPVLWTYAIRRRSHSLFEKGILLGLEIEQIPCAGSRLFLDPAEPPERAAIGIHWELDGRELEAAARFSAALAEAFAARGLGTIELDPRLAARDPALLDTFHDAFHHMGGARMAHSASDGVVDADLRVFGCPNLSVAGAAVFPTGSFANPTLTALALALRLADRLDGELGGNTC